MESSASPTSSTSSYLLYLSSTSSTSSSPFNCPKRLSSASHTEAWSGPGVRLNASEIILGGFRLLFSYCRAGLLFNSSIPHTLFHPRQQAINSSFLLVIRLPPHHLAKITRGITSSSLPPEISIVSRPHQPLTHHNSLRNSAADQFVFTQYIRAVNVVCWMLMVSYIFLSPHAFLVGPVQGVQGTRLHKEP